MPWDYYLPENFQLQSKGSLIFCQEALQWSIIANFKVQFPKKKGCRGEINYETKTNKVNKLPIVPKVKLLGSWIFISNFLLIGYTCI